MNEQIFDVVVVGGGLVGAGIARDAAMRGLTTLVLEQEDFGRGSSGRPARLAHAGLRDLERLELSLVRRTLAERATLGRIAPHLVRPLDVLVPVHARDRRPLSVLGLEVRLYALMTRERLARCRTVDAAEARRLEPALEPGGLAGAALYTDGQIVSPARLALENVLSAREAGAKAVNHVAVTGLRLRDDGAIEVDVRNALTGARDTVGGRVVVNAAGAWGDGIRRLAGLGGPPALEPVKGIHLVVRRLTQHALVVPSRAGGEPLVVVPWQGRSVVGRACTGALDADPGAAAATAGEVDDLLAEARLAIPGAGLTRDDILHACASVETLAAGSRGGGGRGGPAGPVPRRPVIRAEGPRGTFLTVAGGEPAAYRRLAEEVVDRASRLVGRKARPRTAEVPLYGGTIPSLERALATEVPLLARRYRIPQAAAATVVETYGGRAAEVLQPIERERALAEPLCDRGPDLLAQIRYAVEREMAVTLRDLLFRRLAVGTGPCRGRDCARRAAEVMGALAGWDRRRREREVAAYLEEAELTRRYLAGDPRGRAAAGPRPRPVSAR